MRYTYLDIDGFNLRTNELSATIQGLFDAEQDIITNDLYTPGISYNRAHIKERKPTLNVLIEKNIIANLFALRQKLFKAGLKTLTIGIAGMPIFTLQVDVVNWASSQNSIGARMFSCQLEAPDPYLYEQDVQSVALGTLTGSSALTYPITYPITYGNPTGNSGIITNSGNAVAYPVITIVGTCSSIVVTNQTTGESMSCDVSLTDSDTLIVDNTVANRGIYLNGVKRMDLKNGDWISCPPGDNQFLFSRSTLQSKQHCTVLLQGVWI